MSSKPTLYRRHRFPGEIINHAVWLYHLFSLIRLRLIATKPESFINSYNADARPFFWTKCIVHQKRLKPCFAVQ